MFFTQKKTAIAHTMRKLHSIHALLSERAFVGKIEAGRTNFDFTYALQTAAIAGNKLEFTGKVIVKNAAGKTAVAENVKAVLRGVQSAMNSATKPASFKLTVPSAFTADRQDGLPITEFTDARSAVGVMYLVLAPLDGKALGVPFDLSAVQLNGRLAVADQLARDLQWLFGQAIGALESNLATAEPYVMELDRMLRS